jgi:hypothetical protein
VYRGSVRLLLLIGVLAVGACGESRRELYMQGMKAEGDAERGPCKLVYDEQEGANVLSGDQVQACLKVQEEAQALYDRAAAMGLKDPDFVQTRDLSAARIKRLESLLKMVREMERPEYKPLGQK